MTPEPVRLGLALSGGGFRATLFHLGVLTRLAEMDLLRHLHMISSVSGGSVLAAHYMLLLKHELEKSADGRLPRATYVAMIQRLREELASVLARAPRNLLLADPFANLRMAVLGWSSARTSMGVRMAEAYQRLLYRPGTQRAAPNDAKAIARGFRLPDMTIHLPALEAMDDIQRYNALEEADCVPQLVLNSATLNTAARFTFTFAEVGDEMLGYVRFDERALLSHYRRVLDEWKPSDDPERSAARAWAEAGKQPALLDAAGRSAAPSIVAFPSREFVAEHLAWFHAARIEQAERDAAPGRSRAEITARRESKPGGRPAFRPAARSSAVRHLTAHWDHSLRFLDAPFSVLRTAKVAAWYLLDERTWQPRGPETRPEAAGQVLRRGGFTRAEHRERFWTAVRDVDQVMAAAIHTREAALAPAKHEETDWYEFVLELYYVRVARNLEPEDPKDLRLPLAVQASANFPPVFGALPLRGLFDEKRVHEVQLSDGGLNDNNGIEALLEARCTHIIASEAGPRPGIRPPVRLNRLGLLSQIIMNQLPIVRRLLMRTLREQERVHAALAAAGREVREGTEEIRDLSRRYPVEAIAFFDMDSKLSDGVDEAESPRPLAPHPLARGIALLRTDLDGFSAIEQDALVYQGYQYADRFVRRYVYPKLVQRAHLPAVAPPARPPAPLPATEAEWTHARRVMHAGRSLMNRAWGIGGTERVLWVIGSLFGVAALLALAILAAWGRSELLSLWRHPNAIVQGALAVSTWLAAVFAWLIPATDVFGIWLWMDGRLATRAARKR